MKKEELVERIKTGSVITVREEMRFKYGKLERGTTTSYWCDDDRITSVQFDNVRHILGSNLTGLLNTKKYIFNPTYHV